MGILCTAVAVPTFAAPAGEEYLPKIPKAAGKQVIGNPDRGAGASILAPPVRGASPSGETSGNTNGGTNSGTNGGKKDSANDNTTKRANQEKPATQVSAKPSSEDSSGGTSVFSPILLLMIGGVLCLATGMILRRRRVRSLQYQTEDHRQDRVRNDRPTPEGEIVGTGETRP
jgi:hypothetical protein